MVIKIPRRKFGKAPGARSFHTPQGSFTEKTGKIIKKTKKSHIKFMGKMKKR